MKVGIFIFFSFISTVNIFCQKSMKIGDKTLIIIGENIYSYQEIPIEDDEKWVEVYLFISKDSIIVSEIHKLASKSEICEKIFIFSVAKTNIDFTKISVGKHNSHLEKPKDLSKIQLHTIDFEDKIKMDSYSINESLTENVHDLRILVKDIDQGLEIKNKLVGN